MWGTFKNIFLRIIRLFSEMVIVMYLTNNAIVYEDKQKIVGCQSSDWLDIVLSSKLCAYRAERLSEGLTESKSVLPLTGNIFRKSDFWGNCRIT